MQVMEAKTGKVLQRLQIKAFPNNITGNPIEVVLSGNTCTYYTEVCDAGVVEAGIDPQGFYWASWTRSIEISPLMYVIEWATLDEALSDLESEIADEPGPWQAPTTGY
jgi:hypothetical protein